MSNEVKGLRPGMWCKPASEKERNAILELAAAHGIRTPYEIGEWDFTPCIWWFTGYVSDRTLRGCPGNPITVQEFIARLYEQAEINKKVKEASPEIARAVEIYAARYGGPSLEDHEKRIKALEERMEKIEHYAGITALKRQATHGKLKVVEERVSKLEGNKHDWLLTKDHDGLRNAYSILIDPKASPKNLPFSAALEYARAGRHVRRGGWSDGDMSVWVSDGVLHIGHRYIRHAWEDIGRVEIMATDWEVLPA